ncbi:MAG: hypothetical protein RL220_45 [Bacteroidota bacterium]|jgi:LemA protein
MSKSTKAIIAIVLVIGGSLLMFFFYATGIYDKAVASDQKVKESLGNVSSAYQRRADLFQNLVNTVKAAAATENQILVDVVRSRSGMDVANPAPPANTGLQNSIDSLGNVIGQLKGESSGLNSLESIEKHEQGFTQFKTGFNILIERYPDLKSIKNFQDLQVDITGTENRINTERSRYNESVKEHNTLILGFWKSKALSFVGGSQKFQEYKPFEHKAGAEDAPVISFE